MHLLDCYRRTLIKELMDKKYVNCVHPGFVQTEMIDNNGNHTRQEGIEYMLRATLIAVADCPSKQYMIEDKINKFGELDVKTLH